MRVGLVLISTSENYPEHVRYVGSVTPFDGSIFRLTPSLPVAAPARGEVPGSEGG